MFSETVQNFRQDLSAFAPYPAISDRTAWNSLPEDWKAETIRLGEQYLGWPYPALNATEFMDFVKTGCRTRYEDKLFAKRHALNALVLAECTENKGRFLDDIIKRDFCHL